MGKIQISKKIKLTEFLLVFLVVLSGVMLAFSSGSFVINFRSIGFSVVSTVSKGINRVGGGVKDFVGSVSALSK